METVRAFAQYGDFSGEAKADISDHGGIRALAAKFGVKGHPVAVSLYAGNEGDPLITVYTAESCNSYEAVEAQAKASGGKLRVKRYDLEGATVTELLSAFKRFSVVLRRPFQSIQEMEYEVD